MQKSHSPWTPTQSQPALDGERFPPPSSTVVGHLAVGSAEQEPDREQSHTWPSFGLEGKCFHFLTFP